MVELSFDVKMDRRTFDPHIRMGKLGVRRVGDVNEPAVGTGLNTVWRIRSRSGER